MPKATSAGATNDWETDGSAPAEETPTPQETVAAEPEPAPPAQDPADAGYAAMTHAALRDEARTRGLAASGSKADLASRLTEHDQATQAAQTDPYVETEDAAEEPGADAEEPEQ